MLSPIRQLLHHSARPVSPIPCRGESNLGCSVLLPLLLLLLVSELLGALLMEQAGLDLLLEVRGRLGVHSGRGRVGGKLD